ncbi:MAG TPA: phosphatidylglycerol lysyltransferase domain-containing protein [Thermodesulfovibrionales bacterium]|nr:phosphatidylglycerol lysyltransferase domain-containing protein [Thermodesulfovibrionales bacterium]
MRVESLDFGHRELLHDRLKNLDCPIAEYSFPNLYLFRHVHRYEMIFDKEIFIRGLSYDGYTYLMPTVGIENMQYDYIKEMMSTVDFLFPIPEKWLGCFSQDMYDCACQQGDMDYIYTVEQMSTYKGRNLHSKRNLLKQFMSAHVHRALPLTDDRMNDALSVLNGWLDDAGQTMAETDYLPCLEALRKYDNLILCGGIYYADNEPAGFIVGEELNEETFALHFAKARKKFKGIYQYMFNNFAGILPPKYRFLNFEQDLDKDTLRLAKSSYLPHSMLKKARVSLKR